MYDIVVMMRGSAYLLNSIALKVPEKCVCVRVPVPYVTIYGHGRSRLEMVMLWVRLLAERYEQASFRVRQTYVPYDRSRNDVIDFTPHL